ncbi:MAG: sigma-54-dependent transcriptional regulator, partial [Gemmatimonadota bacterium]
IQEGDRDATVIILTAYASVETAVDALKEGAFDYVTKPVDPDELSNLVRNALRQRELTEENLKLKDQVSEMSGATPIIGESPAMKRILEMIRTVAETDSTVVILGESGTGKEIVARTIHAQSKRRFAPIVAVNCGAIPETLLESELFGHEKGSFTGAQYRRKGKIELAHGGTLFLDEIGDITPKMQIDLLRVLESRTFTRLGGNKEIHSDFRLVCATNQNLEKLVKEGEFREDLYYRIKVFSLEIPPLRERADDILPLARHFVTKYARSMGKAEKEISPAAAEVLEGYRWPGNVRELENAIERAMVVGQGGEIRPQDLPLRVEENGPSGETTSLEAMEKDHIHRVLREMDWNVTQSAKVLGIDRATLYNKMKKYGIQR